MANEISKLLNYARNYGWRIRKGCLFQPGVRMRFKRDGQTADVLFCWECNMLAVYGNDDCVGGEDFDLIRPELVRILKRVFPNNPVIQELRESGC